MSPETISLSFILVSDDAFPIEIGTSAFAVPIAIPPVVSVVSMSISSVASISYEVKFKSTAPFTVKLPSIVVSSKVVFPSTSKVPFTIVFPVDVILTAVAFPTATKSPFAVTFP